MPGDATIRELLLVESDMSHWWVSDWYSRSPVLLYSWVLWVVISICLHELGHGWAALRRGDRTPIETGHMTPNPLVHIPPTAWIMFALFGFTWGLMPVDPSRMRGRFADAFVAFAGPLVNLALALLCVVGAALWEKYSGGMAHNVAQNGYTFLWTGAMINTMGFVFNLIPVPPLDGSRIAADFIPSYANLINGPNASTIALVAFAALFFFGAAKVWGFAMVAATIAIDLAAVVVGAQGGGMKPF